jgi:metal-sulfur cluster biosynthetic enzyme
MSTANLVLAELEHVFDPEVDLPVTEMGFIREVEVRGEDVTVHMRLPTYFCAPNFTFLMVDDVRRAAEKVVGAGHVEVDLDGHHDSARISAAVSRGASFAETYSGEAAADLDGLRDHFRRKTFLIRQERVCKALDAAGVSAEALVALTLGDLAGRELPQAQGDEIPKYLAIRRELDLDCASDAAFLVAADGVRVEADRLRHHRRSASVMAISFEGNGVMCRTLIQQRYPDRATTPGEVA